MDMREHTSKTFFQVIYKGSFNILHFAVRFDEAENISSSNQLKTSVQRQIRTAIISQMPLIEDYLPDIWPKKEVTKTIKW